MRFLIERAGMATFLELYGTADPARAFLRLYGANREELVAASAK